MSELKEEGFPFSAVAGASYAGITHMGNILLAVFHTTDLFSSRHEALRTEPEA